MFSLDTLGGMSVNIMKYKLIFKTVILGLKIIYKKISN